MLYSYTARDQLLQDQNIEECQILPKFVVPYFGVKWATLFAFARLKLDQLANVELEGGVLQRLQ